MDFPSNLTLQCFHLPQSAVTFALILEALLSRWIHEGLVWMIAVPILPEILYLLRPCHEELQLLWQNWRDPGKKMENELVIVFIFYSYITDCKQKRAKILTVSGVCVSRLYSCSKNVQSCLYFSSNVALIFITDICTSSSVKGCKNDRLKPVRRQGYP